MKNYEAREENGIIHFYVKGTNIRHNPNGRAIVSGEGPVYFWNGEHLTPGDYYDYERAYRVLFGSDGLMKDNKKWIALEHQPVEQVEFETKYVLWYVRKVESTKSLINYLFYELQDLKGTNETIADVMFDFEDFRRKFRVE